LTGRLPFDGANDFDVMVAQVSSQPPRPGSLNPGIAPELERIVLTALAKKPEERFPGAREFRTALEALKDTLRDSALVADRVPEAATPRLLVPAKARAPVRIPFVLGFVCVVIGLIFLFFVTMHRA